MSGRAWLVAGGVVLALLVVADRAGEQVAERALAERVSGELGAEPVVEVGGVPFLTQALSGRYRDLRLEAPAVTEAGVTLTDVVARLDGARVPLSDALGGRVDRVPVDRLRVQALLTYQELGRAAGSDLQLSAAPDGVRVSGTVRLLGQEVPASAVSTVGLEDGRLVLTARSLQVQGASAQLSRALDLSVDVPELPYGVRLTSVVSGPRGVTVSGTARDTVLTR